MFLGRLVLGPVDGLSDVVQVEPGVAQAGEVGALVVGQSVLGEKCLDAWAHLRKGEMKQCFCWEAGEGGVKGGR